MLREHKNEVFEEGGPVGARFCKTPIPLTDAKMHIGWDSSIALECPIAEQFIAGLPPTGVGDRYIIDSKVVMLMPGMMPCIGGWHFDEVLRDEELGLDYDGNDDRKTHYMMILDEGTRSLTEFYTGKAPLLTTYKELDYELEHVQKSNISPELFTMIQPNRIYQFDWSDAHRGTPASDKGWRYFIRATKYHQRAYINKFRKQVQVYVESFSHGW